MHGKEKHIWVIKSLCTSITVDQKDEINIKRLIITIISFKGHFKKEESEKILPYTI